MGAINAVTDLTNVGRISVITLNSPPVNALSADVRDGLDAAFTQASADPATDAIVLICEGKTFIAGADISEFGKPPRGANLRDVQNRMENASKPVIGAIHGTSLGGGFEVALCCHYRVAVPSAKCGLPEVHLGLLPGAGGTQRLPRIVGPERALEMVTSGAHVPAKECLAMGLVDALAEEGKLRETAIAFAEKVVAEKRPLRRVRDMNEKVEAARGKPEIFANFRKKNARAFRGFMAPESNIKCIEAAVNLPFDEGIAEERRLFTELVTGSQSAAQRYTFFAEREVWKIPDVPADTPIIAVKTVGIIGAGTMGGGIAMNFVNVGYPVTIVETTQEALDRGLKVVRANYERSAKNGRFTMEQVEQRMALITGTTRLEDIANVDLVIEAVFERMEVKKEIFTKLDSFMKQGAILGTNTSALNIDEIASVTKRPQDVIGLHFFSPANVMRLLEVVRADHTSKSVIATSMQIAKKIGKIAALVGVCPGFVGNRILAARRRAAEQLLMSGTMPWDIDRVLYDFGFPMGVYAMSDLAGLDLGWVKAESKGLTIRDRLCELDRRGQKTGKGWYDYDENRNPSPSPVTEGIIKEFITKAGNTPRQAPDDEILERCLLPMINEGAKILAERKAIRASDIDIIYQAGYGFPKYRGGPMFYADLMGLDKVVAKLRSYSALGADFEPAPLLVELAAAGKRFQDWRAA